ncbi:hypothetical protein B0J14DRAFT_550743 [Halenospora varia]|nr:hypothetical protein B0J14DRAFT_550743 [Halenospora varia]
MPRPVIERELDPLLLHIEVPCVCPYNDFCSPEISFLDIPKRYGVHWDMAENTEFSGLDEEQAPSFVQGWLFFAMLKKVSDILGVSFKPIDFVTFSPEKCSMISGRSLKKYTWLWTSALFYKTIDETRACLTNIKAHLDIMNRVANAWIEQDHTPISAVFDRILLGIVVLGETFMFLISKMIGSALSYEMLRPVYRWIYPKCGRKLLIQAGWCEGELPMLLAKCPPTILLYLSTFDRKRSDKDHSRCSGEAGCVVNQLDLKTYQTSHSLGCHDENCQMIEPPIQEVCRVLQSGGIPVVKVSTTDPSLDPTLEVHAFKLDSKHQELKYVAISHVWSDGMGNPGQNSLRACQVRRIQRAVNLLYPSASSSQKVPFWMDTLCIPLQSEIRNLAIMRMAKTYLHADKVLVLDTWLSQNEDDMALGDLLVKITHSDWNTRLWTFQESILARESHFQFHDIALTVDDLKDSATFSGNLQQVSHIISNEDKTELVQDQNMLNIIRALTSVDTWALERRKTYAALEPQSYPELEELRLHAIENMKTLTDQTQIFERWFPRQLKAFKDYSPSILLSDTARGLPGRTTSRLEDETICLGGIIGLDVAPLLRTRIKNETKRGEELESVCASRMKIFLSMIKIFPSSILFWESQRIRESPWKWAPLSFLDKRACVAMSVNASQAECAPEGLLASYNGIHLNLNGYSAIEKRFRTLRIRFTDPETADAGLDYYPFRHSWEAVELHVSNASPHSEYSWYDCFSGIQKEIALIVFGEHGLEGILVRISKTEDNVIHASYLSNVSRVTGDDEPEYLGSYVDGEWMGMKRWCIG